MTTRSLMLLFVAAAGCSTKTADKPVLAPAPAAPTEDVPAMGAPIGDGAGRIRIVYEDLDRVEVVQAVDDSRTVLASLQADRTSLYDAWPDGAGAIVVERSDVAGSGRSTTAVWRYRWSAAQRRLVANGSARALPGEALPAWVPEVIRTRHVGNARYAHGEEPCRPAPRAHSRVTLDNDVEAVLVCDHVNLEASLVVFEGDTRHELTRLGGVIDELGLVQDPTTREVVAFADGKAFSVEWDGTNGPGSRPLEKVPAFAKAVMP